jgi:hypothetical protein
MNPVYADTFYFLALLNVKDAAHARARQLSALQTAPIVTTTWVLTEVGNALARSARRQAFCQLLEELERDTDTLVVPASEALFRRGVQLYGERLDKEWSLTDCISFLVMRDRSLTDALTADRHFEQAGFVALLKV